MSEVRGKNSIYHNAFHSGGRVANFCNWCGNRIATLLVHHGDGDHYNNDPLNLWALCSVSCHNQVHIALLDGIEKRGNAGRIAHQTWSKERPEDYTQHQSTAGKIGGASRKSQEPQSQHAQQLNKTKVECPECERIIGNIGALAIHMRVHQGGE